MKEDKRVRWSWEYLNSIPETENLYLLTEREVQALITPLSVSSWKTRWTDTVLDWEEINTFIANVQERLLSPVDICELISECIATNEGTQSALKEYILEKDPTSQGGTGVGIVLPQSVLDTQIISTCDNGNIYAATTQLVDFVNNAIIDFLQVVESGTGRIERSNLVISAIPIFGILPVDEFIAFLDQILDNFTANYEAQYTLALRDEYACELFCISQENCYLTFEQMATYFQDKAMATFNRVSLSEAIDWFIFGTWTGDLIVHAMHALFCWAIVWGSEFFGINLNKVTRIVQAASNDTDPDWSVKCDDCFPTPITLILGYSPCSANNVGLGTSFSLYGASPLNAAWTRYIAKPIANSAPVYAYNFGLSVTEIEGRAFTLKSIGFHSSPSGGADGNTCNGAVYERNLPSFGTTVTQNRYGVQIVTNTVVPMYYIDILV